MAVSKLSIVLLIVAATGVLSVPLDQQPSQSTVSALNNHRGQRSPLPLPHAHPLSLNAQTIRLNDPELQGATITSNPPKVPITRAVVDPAEGDLQTAETFLLPVAVGIGGYGGLGFGGYGGFGYGGGFGGGFGGPYGGFYG